MKFKAFTIAELVVAMAISAIVATIGYVAFNNIGKTAQLKSNGLAEIEQIQELRFLLKKDFSQYHDWEIINENKFQSYSGEVSYEFLENKIIRIQLNNQIAYEFAKVSVQKDQETGQFQILLTRGTKQMDLGFEIKNNILIDQNSAND